jgi:3',5'-cyclic-nucleotide phosphodiesterase
LLEVSFPDREQKLANVSGHTTSAHLAQGLEKYQRPKDLPALLYHIKPVFQSEGRAGVRAPEKA